MPHRHTFSRALRRAALPLALLCSASFALAASPAASACPYYYFLSDNFLPNADLETPDASVPLGATTCWKNGQPVPPPSAAADWVMHSSNAGAKVCSTLVKSNAPGALPNSRMMKFVANGNEGGIQQRMNLPAGHGYMFSAWIKVLSGHVVLQPNGGTQGPAAWSSKIGEWEQLRVCTNSTGVVDLLDILNEDGAGGSFYVDRIELREIPVLE